MATKITRLSTRPAELVQEYISEFCKNFMKFRAPSPGGRKFNKLYKGDRSYPQPPIVVSAPTITKSLEGAAVLASSGSVKDFVQGRQHGKVHPTQLSTFMRIQHELVTNDRNIGIVAGPTNSGKTGLMQAARMSAVIHKAITGQDCVVAHIFPNSHRLMQQTEDAHDQHVQLHSQILFEGRFGTFSYPDYSEIEERFENRVREYCRKMTKPVTLSNKESPLRVLANNGAKTKFEAVLACARENDTAVIVIYDEIHSQDTPHGFQNWVWTEMERYWADGHDGKLIGFSATPFPFGKRDRSRVWIVRMTLGDSYRGFNWFDGDKIDPDANVLPPDMETFDHAGHRMGAKYFQFIRRNLYKNFSLKQAKKLGVPEQYRTAPLYRRMCEKAMAQGIRHSLIEKNDRRGKGLILRWVNKNSEAEVLAEKLRARLPEVDFEVFAGAANRNSMGDTIRTKITEGKPFVLIVTGAGRMGDDVPADVTYFWDFTEKTTKVDALLQGLLGRACGWNKNSLVTMHEFNIFTATAYAERGEYQINPNSNMYIRTGMIGRPRSTMLAGLRIHLDDPEPEAKLIIEKFRKRTSHLKFIHPKERKKGARLSVQYRDPNDGRRKDAEMKYVENFYQSPSIMRALQKIMKSRGLDGEILQPGGIATYKGKPGYQLRVNDEKVSFGFRNATTKESPEASHGGDQAEIRSERYSKASGKLFEPQVHVWKGQPLMVSLPFVEPIERKRPGVGSDGLQIAHTKSSQGRPSVMGDKGYQDMLRENAHDER